MSITQHRSSHTEATVLQALEVLIPGEWPGIDALAFRTDCHLHLWHTKAAPGIQFSSLSVSAKKPLWLTGRNDKRNVPRGPTYKTHKAGHVGTAKFYNCWNYPSGSHSHLGQVGLTLLGFFFFFLVLLHNSVKWEKHQNCELSSLLVS